MKSVTPPKTVRALVLTGLLGLLACTAVWVLRHNTKPLGKTGLAAIHVPEGFTV